MLHFAVWSIGTSILKEHDASKMLVPIQQAVQHHIPEGCNLNFTATRMSNPVYHMCMAQYW